MVERGASIGRFVAIGALGAGATGSVWAAYDPSLGRKVAIKLVRPDAIGGAQAAARLAHPNVVTIYEVGAFGDQTFVAMELVDGGTLSDWLHAAPRSWRQKLALFLRAASGLGAAHAAGLVHRDFTADAVLVDGDGRVRVTDFRLMSGADGASADCRAFCAALDQALRDDPAVPARLRRVLERGLSPDPAPHHPTLAALVADLSRDSRRTLRRVATATALSALLAWVGVATWHARATSRQACTGAKRELAGVWDEPVKQRARAAFLATGLPYAERAWQDSARRLDDYAGAWVRMHTSACEATHRGEQSELALDLRMGCLARRRTELAALTSVFGSADATVVEKANSAASSLTDVAGCADLERLSATQPLPQDAAARVDIASVRAQLAVAAAYRQGGKYRLGLTVAGPALAAARRIAYAPVLGEALLVAGRLRTGAGEDSVAEQLLFDAIVAAASASDTEVEVDARAQLANTQNVLLRFDEALRSTALASALLSRLPDDPLRQSELRCVEGNSWYFKGAYDEARISYQRGLDLLDKLRDPPAQRVASCLRGLGIVAQARSRYPEAIAYQSRSLALFENALGPEHPRVAQALYNLAIVYSEEGHADAALPLLERALAINERSLGPEHPAVADCLLSIGDIQQERGDYELALATFLHGLAVAEKAGRTEKVADFHLRVGVVRQQQGRLDLALDEDRRALAIQEQSRGPGNRYTGWTRLEIGTVQARMGDRKAALDSMQQALTILEKSMGRDSRDVAAVLSELGLLSSDMGDQKLAVTYFTRAEGILNHALGKESRDYGLNEARLAGALARAGRHAEALGRYQVALETFDRPRDIAWALTGIGRCRRALGTPGEAVEPLQRAVGLLEAAKTVDVEALADARAELARARRASHQDR